MVGFDNKLRLPKRLRRSQSDSHRRAPKQEQEAAERFGGQVTKGSGSGYQKADVRAYRFVRVEAKTTKHLSFSVTMKMINKLEADTFGADEIPFMEIELGLGEKKVYVFPDWAIELVLGLDVTGGT